MVTKKLLLISYWKQAHFYQVKDAHSVQLFVRPFGLHTSIFSLYPGKMAVKTENIYNFVFSTCSQRWDLYYTQKHFRTDTDCPAGNGWVASQPRCCLPRLIVLHLLLEIRSKLAGKKLGRVRPRENWLEMGPILPPIIHSKPNGPESGPFWAHLWEGAGPTAPRQMVLF